VDVGIGEEVWEYVNSFPPTLSRTYPFLSIYLLRLSLIGLIHSLTTYPHISHNSVLPPPQHSKGYLPLRRPEYQGWDLWLRRPGTSGPFHDSRWREASPA
jgi:hypothetical protein